MTEQLRSLASRYAGYASSPVLTQVAESAHGPSYVGQTSSATPTEVVAAVGEASEGVVEPAILDAGCGNGCFSILLAEALAGRVVGVDISEELIATAKRVAGDHDAGGSLEFRVADFAEADLSTEAFDVILCVGSLYWGVDPAVVVERWTRALKRHGAIVIFSNLSTGEVTASAALEDTSFISAGELREAFAKWSYDLEETDLTPAYVDWLVRWRHALREHRDALSDELGPEAAARFEARFQEYEELARAGSVRRYQWIASRRPDGE